MLFPKPKRIQDQALKDSLKTGYCVISHCRRRGVDPAHVKTVGSHGDDVISNLMCLCRWHHVEQHQIGIITFTRKYPSVLNFLRSHGWELQEIFGRFRLIKSQD